MALGGRELNYVGIFPGHFADNEKRRLCFVFAKNVQNTHGLRARAVVESERHLVTILPPVPECLAKNLGTYSVCRIVEKRSKQVQ